MKHMIFVKDISNPENSFCKQSSQIYIEDINLGIIHVWYKPKKLEIWSLLPFQKRKTKDFDQNYKKNQNVTARPMWLNFIWHMSYMWTIFLSRVLLNSCFFFSNKFENIKTQQSTWNIYIYVYIYIYIYICKGVYFYQSYSLQPVTLPKMSSIIDRPHC